ncbi:MAG: helix-turn-helix transcriptional regulator [Oscillospiraceae bacterium]|nr:helix-turn-helix transcriptional regulator [Oscillospiraceae bacterium]
MDEHVHHSSGALQQEPDQEHLAAVAELLGLFADKTRVRILSELLREELCVSDIAQHLGMTASAISHQLRILKQGRLVRSRREGKTVYYSLADSHVETIFYHALEHVME